MFREDITFQSAYAVIRQAIAIWDMVATSRLQFVIKRRETINNAIVELINHIHSRSSASITVIVNSGQDVELMKAMLKAKGLKLSFNSLDVMHVQDANSYYLPYIIAIDCQIPSGYNTSYIHLLEIMVSK